MAYDRGEQHSMCIYNAILYQQHIRIIFYHVSLPCDNAPDNVFYHEYCHSLQFCIKILPLLLPLLLILFTIKKQLTQLNDEGSATNIAILCHENCDIIMLGKTYSW